MTTTMLNPRIVFGAVLVAIAIAAIVGAGIRNVQTSQGPRERRFILLMTPLLWALLISFMASVYWLAAPWRYLAALAHFVVIPTFMYRCTLRRQLIREWESRRSPDAEVNPET